MDILDLYPVPLKYAKNVACDDFRDEIDAPNRKVLLEQALKNLHDREGFILRRIWFNQFTLREIGKLVCLSTERVRQIGRRAIRKLRHPKISSHEIRDTYCVWRVREKRENERTASEKYAENLRRFRQENPYEEVVFNKRQAWLKQKKQGALEIVRSRRQLKLFEIQAERDAQNKKDWEDIKARFRRNNQKPPHFIQLMFDKYGNPYLWCEPHFGRVERGVDPECYDMWLRHLLKEYDKKLKEQENIFGQITSIEQLPRSILDNLPFRNTLFKTRESIDEFIRKENERLRLAAIRENS